VVWLTDIDIDKFVGTIIEGDCLEVLPAFPANSIDAIVTDPPAGIGFMNRKWDKAQALGVSGGSPVTTSSRNPLCRNCGCRKRAVDETPKCTCLEPDWNDDEWRLKDRDAFVGWMTQVMTECHRVLKPGGHVLVWALPRTSHWTGWAIESAGFEVRDRVIHAFASGFPKSHNVSAAIDSMLGVDREVIGTVHRRDIRSGNYMGALTDDREGASPNYVEHEVTAPGSDEAKEWDGYGTALKPAYEDWWLARKPMAASVAVNVLKYGTGALDINGARIPADFGAEYGEKWLDSGRGYGKPWHGSDYTDTRTVGERVSEKGRWPANLVLTDPILDGDYEGVVGGGERTSGIMKADTERNSRSVDYGKMPDKATLTDTYGDSGGASRFFMIPRFIFVPKAPRSQKEPNWHGLQELGNEQDDNTLGPMAGRGQPGLKCRKCGKWKVSGSPCVCPEPDFEQSKFERPKVFNSHPTVKNVDLMVHLVRLITPPGGVVLDCFAGSGSTLKAADIEGRRWIGIEEDPDYVKIARARLAGTPIGLGLDAEVKSPPRKAAVAPRPAPVAEAEQEGFQW
jgi:DNA modification methylase